MLAGVGAASKLTSDWLLSPANPFAYVGASPVIARALEVFAHAAAPRGKPAFGLDTTIVDGVSVAVSEEIVLRKPFGQLKHFVRAVSGRHDPRLLIVAPMSGHFATLLRGTVERMLPGHDVYVTDWRDAKMVPLADGNFDFNDYIDYLIEFMGAIGPGAHMLAVCQPAVPAFAAAALMNKANDPNAPLTLTMMGGPIDTREAPTSVDDLATERPYAWFENNVVATVPPTYPGSGRKVYPGFLQLAGFLSMNLASHMKSHWELFKHLVAGDDDSADATKAFYDEYRSVADMTAEFYLQTIDVVFQKQLIAKGCSTTAASASMPAISRQPRCWRSRASATTSRGSARPRSRCGWRATSPRQEAILSRDRRRALRHLQRPQVARHDRPRRRGLHPRPRPGAGRRRSRRPPPPEVEMKAGAVSAVAHA